MPSRSLVSAMPTSSPCKTDPDLVSGRAFLTRGRRTGPDQVSGCAFLTRGRKANPARTRRLCVFDPRAQDGPRSGVWPYVFDPHGRKTNPARTRRLYVLGPWAQDGPGSGVRLRVLDPRGHQTSDRESRVASYRRFAHRGLSHPCRTDSLRRSGSPRAEPATETGPSRPGRSERSGTASDRQMLLRTGNEMADVAGDGD